MKILLLCLILLTTSLMAPMARSNELLASSDVLQIKQLISRLYPKSNPTKFSPGVPLSEVSPCFFCFSAESYRELFVSEIADKLNNQSGGENELVFCLDYGVIVDGQDLLITDFRISDPVISQESVQASVQFKNFDKPDEVTFTFLHVPHKTHQKKIWRIEEITSQGLRFSKELERCK